MKLVLASGSRYRAEVLSQLQLPFEQINSNIKEGTLKNEPAHELAARLAYEKALAVAQNLPYPALVIGSDQVACINGQQLCKPMTTERARQQLTDSSGQTGYFYTGCCVINSQTNAHFSALDTVTVQFRSLSAQQIDAYIKKDDPLDCAGSFKIESLGITLMEKVHSEDPTSLVGLGLISLCTLLRKHGFEPLA